ncbi:MAG: serine hydroxymethyltransferase [Candidatus Harrisonbacteria bacterium]|nr:serine hydroxymethyltransferase [Candidatus Harrisonbacteria bacterium]
MKDKKIEALIKKEVKRQQLTIDLIASENYASKEVLQVLGSPLQNKYSEGYPGKRYYPGNAIYDEIECLAQDRARAVFGLKAEEWGVNVQVFSGSPANIAVYVGLVPPGETIMGMGLSFGGHLSHGHPVSLSGRLWRAVHYSVNAETGLIDYDAVRALAQKEKPKVLVSGFTAYPRQVDFKRMGEIAHEVGAYHLADISHISGLVAAGIHPSPFPHADVVMTTTHKTLRGPRGAVIFSRCSTEPEKNLSAKIDKAVFPGLQGGPHNNVTAAKAVAFFEALQPSFKKYQQQIVKNAKALAKEFIARGFPLLSGGTDTHLMLLDMRRFNIDGKSAEERLELAGIVANRNSLPGDDKPLKPSGVRVGTPPVTTRGMKEKEMFRIAEFFERLFVRGENPASVKKDVEKLCKKFPLPYK